MNCVNKVVPGRTKAEWYLDHYDEQNQRIKAYNAEHAEHLHAKHSCPCGGRYTTNGKSKHAKSIRHVAWLAKAPK